jgi:hypothetical protein
MKRSPQRRDHRTSSWPALPRDDAVLGSASSAAMQRDDGASLQLQGLHSPLQPLHQLPHARQMANGTLSKKGARTRISVDASSSARALQVAAAAWHAGLHAPQNGMTSLDLATQIAANCPWWRSCRLHAPCLVCIISHAIHRCRWRGACGRSVRVGRAGRLVRRALRTTSTK